jgi:hypothetical protein
MAKYLQNLMIQIVISPSPIPALVLLIGDIDVIRAKQMIQDKAQAADNGMPLLRAVTADWIICLAPFGRVGKQSFAALHLLERTSHSLRGVPCTRPLPNSLNMPMSPFRSTRCPCTPGLALPSIHSYGYGYQSSATSSRT